MNDCTQWLRQIGQHDAVPVDGLVLVNGYNPLGRAPEEVEVVFKARDYGAYAVFFQAPSGGRPPIAEAFVYLSDGPPKDPTFAELHRRIWSWGVCRSFIENSAGSCKCFDVRTRRTLFDIDYYDLHWLPRDVAIEHDLVWRSDLLGGGRVLDLAERLQQFRTIDEYVSEPEQKDWDRGEGFIEGAAGLREIPEWIADKPLLPSEALTERGIDEDAIAPAPHKRIEGPRSKARFTPPMLLIREQMDIPHALWTKEYLTYKNQIVGVCAPETKINELIQLEQWLSSQKNVLQAYLAMTSIRVFTQRGTSLGSHDILSLPYPKKRSFEFSAHEQILMADIVDHYRDFVRVGEKSRAMQPLDLARDSAHRSAFSDVYESRINAIYRNKLQRLPVQTWPGIICQPFVFGKGTVDWSGAEALRGKLDSILHEKIGQSLHITRIARIYDRSFIFLLKPNRLRYWLRSIALRDADETLAELRAQGF